MNKVIPVAAVIIVVLVIAVVLVSYPNIIPKTTSSTNTTAVPIAMTDPAEVPANTTSLYISYSSFKILYFYANGSGNFANVNASGSINLLSLVNTSKVLASANLPVNSMINSIQFSVVSANITINGTTYTVKVPSPIVSAIIPANFNKVNSSSGLILDFTPAVVTVYTANSTQYILIPSLMALSSKGLTNRAVGAVEHIPANINRSLFLERPNITITSASLQQVGNSTRISVTVKDNSNQSVILQHLRLSMVNGFKLSTLNFSVNLSGNTIQGVNNYRKNLQNQVSVIKSEIPSIIGNLNRSLVSNLSSINASLSIGGYNFSIGNGINGRFDNIKSRVESQFNKTEGEMHQNLVANENRVNIMNRIVADRSVNFFISSNATLFLPFSGSALFNLPINISPASVQRINSTDVGINYNYSGLSNSIEENSNFSLPTNFGYSLRAGSSVTLTFLGGINLGNGLLSLELVPGTQYNLYLQGTNGAMASYTVNATS
ncbi:DUF4382 domain-containing protein [Candidatus Parvarchaeota archaeon]|nr:DUF4382 domain-containing protein [Candidatus Parvarchaeota archaeon]